MHIASERRESLGNMKSKLLKNFVADPFFLPLSQILRASVVFLIQDTELKLLNYFSNVIILLEITRSNFKFQNPHRKIHQNLLSIRSIITELYIY